jgi:hypothetical protein
MKRIYIITGLIIFTLNSHAQINLEHSSTSSTLLISSFKTSSNGIMFYTSPDTVSNQLKLYNEDFSLYKTIIIPRPAGYSTTISSLSDKLFNSNNSIEFICIFQRIYATPTVAWYVSKIIIYDENLTVLKDFGTYNNYIVPSVISEGSVSKLLFLSWSPNSNSQYVNEIYTLPGSLPNNIAELKLSDIKSAFPNPAKTIITLPYVLANEQTSTIRIYKLNGQFVDSKQIDSTFDKILLNVESYQPGIYIYEYNGISNKFVVN